MKSPVGMISFDTERCVDEKCFSGNHTVKKLRGKAVCTIVGGVVVDNGKVL